MIPNVSRFAFRGATALASSALVTLLACTSSSPNNTNQNDSGSDSGPQASMCAAPGKAAPGPQDTHCVGVIQPTCPAACSADGGPEPASFCADAGGGPGDDGGGSGDDSGSGGDSGSGDDSGIADAGDIGNCGDSRYGATMYGNSASDDDCKYDVHWTSTPICEGAPGVYFTVTATKRTDNSPLTGANARPDVVLNCSHPIPNAPNPNSPEISPGTYLVGPVIFDKPGRWVFRFHFNEDCYDNLPNSPHGHAAFYIDVP
jgi:hypothetical protein